MNARRTAFALRIVRQAGLYPATGMGARLAAAFSAIARERFLGPPPWRILAPSDHSRKVTEDAADLYDDVLVSLAPAAGLNNGQPSLHAACLAALHLSEGEGAVHVGAGMGYYTAIVATLVGPEGHVDAYEIEPELAARAAQNLAGFAQVTVHGRSGTVGPLPECDALYVNAGSPEPLAVWLDALRVGGRLLFPLAPAEGPGEMLLVRRRAEASYAAHFLGAVEFVPCVGTQDAHAGRALAHAFRKGGWKEVKSLHRFDAPDESCWVAGKNWWLSMRD